MKKALWIIVFLAVLVWSGIAPKDTMTWGLEVFPAILGAIPDQSRTARKTIIHNVFFILVPDPCSVIANIPDC